MKALVVYESMWGNTEQIARAIASGLEASGEVELVEVGSAPAEPGPDVDVLVVGGPTHAFSLSRASTRADAVTKGADHGQPDRGLRDWLSALSAGHRRQQVATFDTRVERMRRLPGSAARSAARLAHRHGFTQPRRVQSFYVVDVDGPLVSGELERAVAWGREVGSDVPRDPS